MSAHERSRLEEWIRRWGFRLKLHNPKVWWKKLVTARAAFNFPPQEIPFDDSYELHVLCSRKDFVMMLWCLCSFYHFSPRKPRLVIHDDGSLRPSQVSRIAQLFPGTRVISRADADDCVNATLVGHPRSLAMRKKNVYALKIFDIFALAEADQILLLDADLLFFGDPRELVSPEPGNRFIEDAWTNYCLSPAEMKSEFGISVPEGINVGCAHMERKIYDLDFIEDVLRLEAISEARYFIDQTVIALMASRTHAETLNGPYRMTMEPGFENRIVNHYTRVIRHRFYTEGVPRLKAILP